MTDPSFLRRLGIEHPIIAAPMGGGPSTPGLVAAVSNAGGLGSVAGAYLRPAEIADELRRVRALTGRPFAVNLFAGGYHLEMGEPAPMLALMRTVHQELGLPEPSVSPVPPDPFPAQLQVVLDERPAAFSFTFGIPPADALRRLRERGIVAMGTATTVEEGTRLATAGVDAIVAQGAEAGAHRGTFASGFEEAMVPTLELTAAVVAATRLPVIASGGVMDGRDVAAALAAGAVAVQMGTAFVPCVESGAAEAYKQAILAATDDRTVITRAFSGRPARGIENAFILRVEPIRDAILPFPAQNALTRPMRAAAGKRGEAGYLSLWAGTEAHRARALSAAELVRVLVAELRAGEPASA
ncbi:MAG TPA: nitronate monooxygenase [Longimicrobium sp.]|jgi:nitronate monooxygenase|nr:nitronate monooxygenase [Longimicrobium sp.]